MSDLISRQAVLKIIDGWYDNNRDTENIEDLIVLITYMDSVNPQESKTGHWIPTYGNVKCSVCGSVKESRRVGKATHYCDFCGAKMVEGSETE